MAELKSTIVQGNLRVTDEINAGAVKVNGTNVLTSHQSVSSSNNTASWGSAVVVGTVGGTQLKFTMPNNPNSNTTYTFAEGSTNGAFSVTPSGGSAQSVAIHGLGSAAYKSTGTGSGNIPVLDSNGKLSTSILPALAITDTFVCASQAAMLALTAQVGDVCVRTDLNKSFILKTDGASTLANWQELLTPTDAVTSVNGSTGAVTFGYLASASVSGHTLTLNPSSGSAITFTDTTYESKTAASGGTAVSLVTTGEKYTWNNKSSVALVASGGTNGTATTAARSDHTHSTYVPKTGLSGSTGGFAQLGVENVSGEDSIGYVSLATGITMSGQETKITSEYIKIGDYLLYYPSLSSDAVIATQDWVDDQGYTSNTGTVIGSGLTANYFVVGNGTVNVKISSLKPTTSSTTWSTSSDVNVPTMKAISSYVTGLGYTSNAGTVTSVGTGVGLTGGTITGSGTIKAKLNSETSLGTIGTTSKLYAVGVDSNGQLCVNVPWTDSNAGYYHTTGSWSGLTYTATANGGAGALVFTIPTGTSASTVAVGNHTHFYLATEGDNRYTATAPNNYSNKLTFAGLKENSYINTPSSDTYSYVLGLRGWSDNSGGYSHEFAFNDSGIFHRQENGSNTWGSWSKLAYTSDIPTNNNQLTNGAGYITSSGSCASATSAGSATVADNVSYIDARSNTSNLPSSANTSGQLKFVLCASEPSTKYDGYVYLILS